MPVSDEVEARLVEWERQGAQIRENLNLRLANLRKDWGKRGSQKQQIFEQDLIYQLENDPLYKHFGPTRECQLFLWYHELRNS